MNVLTQPAPPVTVSRSKIEPPLLSGQWVRRPLLETRLDRALARSLVVIAAPAGHGKTSTIVSWLRLRGFDAAWVSIDGRDADLTRFATHVAVALDRVVPGIVPALFPLLTVPDRLPPTEVGEAFGESLYDLERDVVLVLDDFHAASNVAAGEFVVGLLHAAPRRLHTILSSRQKPPFSLSRLRTTGEVEELTGADLRFSPQETGELLQVETGEEIAPELATRVHASVGGWPAAIRLIAVSRRASSDVQTTVVTQHQEQLLLDYLGDEVLSRLPSSQRELLLRASLVDRFNAPLLETLAIEGGEPISRADVERLRALELFREIPGLDETWFTYHVLFREVLRTEFERTSDSAAIADLHRIAAGWFASAGHVQDATHHLIEAGDTSAAASLIESRLIDAFASEDWQTVSSWLRLVSFDELQRRPELLLASAWVAYLSGREPRIVSILNTLRDPSYRALMTEPQRAELALLAEQVNSDPQAVVETTEGAIALIPTQKRYRYGYAHMTVAMALTTAGRAEEALARLAAFTRQESARIDAASIRGYFGRVIVLWQVGKLAHCEQVAADQLQLARTNDLRVSAGWAALFLGACAHERGDLAQATRYVGTVIADAERVHFMCVRDAFFIQVLVYEAQGLRSEADRTMTRLREIAIASETLHQLDLLDSFAARLALMRGELSTAARWLGTVSFTIGQDDLKSIELPLLTHSKILIASGRPDALVEAERLLTEFVTTARARHMMLAQVEGLAVQALLHDARGEQVAATRVLRESLQLAAPEGIVQRYAYLGPALAPILRRLLTDPASAPHARKVLAALEVVLSAHPALPSPELPRSQTTLQNPLSAREIEVLHCLARRLTNDEIGDELFISPITVKHHVANISGKLAVSGRRAAVARATELGLIG